MDDKTQARFEARARILKALAHPSRLFIVDQLAHGECCVRELTAMVGSDMSTVSKHLSVLKLAGVVADEKRGVQIYYRLRLPCVLGFLYCVSQVLEQPREKHLNVANIRRRNA